MTTTKPKTQTKTQLNTRHLPAQPGDIWVTQRKNSLGVGSKLMCTDEEWDENPGFYRFYYLIGCANIGPGHFLTPRQWKGLIFMNATVLSTTNHD